MNTQRYSDTGARDPVICCIEECLQTFENEGFERLTRTDEGKEIELRFGTCSARANTYEIALLRLAMELVEHPSKGAAMRQALQPYLRSEN